MQIFNTLNKKALIATMIAATGLPASLANAQFKVEYDTKDKSASNTKTETKEEHVIVIRNHDDKNDYEVKVVNGIVKFAEMNGKQLDHDRIKMHDNVIIFLSEDGKELTEIKVPGMAKVSGHWIEKDAKGQAFAIRSASPAAPDAPLPARVVSVTSESTPKVMLGINLTEPSDAVRKQLKLGDKQAIFVEKVIDGLPAKKAGLENFDVIISLDGSEYANSELLSKVLRKKEPGDALKMVVLRGGEQLKIKAELAPYNAQKLGTTMIAIESDDVDFPAIWEEKNGNRFEFGLDFDFGPEIHEQIQESLRASGLNDDQLAIVHEQLHNHLSGLHEKIARKNQFFFAPDAQANEHEHIIELEREMQKHAEKAERQRVEVLRSREAAQVAQEKARAAMRDAQRQVMELRDGRLIVKQAEEMEDHLATLEDRLSALEDRLENQMDRMETQMDRLADMFERLLDRLEDED